MKPDSGETPWVVVAGGAHFAGGMDKANAALVLHLSDRGTPVHLVSHQVDASIAARRGVVVHLVKRPFRSNALGEWSLGLRGRTVARAVSAANPSARVVVNGGNCAWPDVNWAHCVHHAWPCADAGAPAWFRVKNRAVKAVDRRRERAAMREARIVIANSNLTRRHAIDCLGLDPQRVRTIYLGSDAGCLPATAAERSAARKWLEVPCQGPIVAFVGALGHDNNKGLDVLWAAWQRLSSRPGWDATLVVAGGGGAVPHWRNMVARAGLAGSVRIIGFTRQVNDLLAAADLLVSPARYEAYGLNVHEAICRGAAAITSSRAGIAERFPPELRDFVLDDPEDVDALVARLEAWRREIDPSRARFAPLAASLRSHGWNDMAAAFVRAVDESRG